jgi:geranylgeranylglycerol-phosphate geranylgeranyltransferase
VNPWVRLLRPGNGAISFIGTVVGGLAATGISHGNLLREVAILLAAAFTTFLANSGGNVLNDYLDREGDRKNHPDRPLPQGEVEPGQVRVYSAGLFVASAIPLLALAALGDLPSGIIGSLLPFLIWGFAVALLLLYELRWKANGLVGNSTVGLLTGTVFLFGAAVVGSPVLIIPLAGMATLATLSREVIKDMEDVEGDVDRRTLPREHGMGVATGAARAAVIAAIVLSPLPSLTWLPPFSGGTVSLAGIIYLALVAAADLVFVVSVKDLPEQLHREQSLSKLAMVVALIGFLGAGLR